MIESILKGFLFLVTTLFDMIFSPIISVITALFPNLALYFTYITNFITYALSYVVTLRELLLIPRAAMLFLFDYFLITFTIYITMLAVRFVVTIYNKFKP